VNLTDAPLLAGLPWELLYDQNSNRFLAQSERTPLVRYLDQPFAAPPLTVSGPLHIAVILSSPMGLPPLQVEEEWQALNQAIAVPQAAGRLRMTRLAPPTMGTLQQLLREQDIHVLHFIGHGDFDTAIQDGVLYFEDLSGGRRAVTSSILGPHVHDHESLRLLVLNACHTGRADGSDPYSGMAQGLLQQGAPSVVAMQFPITDDAAILFTREFYSALSAGQPVEQALSAARKALLSDHGVEWATPVLFLRAPEGRLFNVGVTSTTSNATPTPSEYSEPAASTSPSLAPALAAPMESVTSSEVRPAEQRRATSPDASITAGPVTSPTATINPILGDECFAVLTERNRTVSDANPELRLQAHASDHKKSGAFRYKSTAVRQPLWREAPFGIPQPKRGETSRGDPRDVASPVGGLRRLGSPT
jgi:hypothetical protein